MRINPCFGWRDWVIRWSTVFDRTSIRQKVLLAARRGDFSPLLRDAESSLNATICRFGDDHPETARKIAALAAVEAMRGETVNAESLYRRAIDVLSHSHRESERLESLTLREQLADLHYRSNEPPLAQTLYAELYSEFDSLHDRRPHPDVARTLDKIALTLKAQGKNTAAKEKHRAALLIWEQVRGPGSSEVARCLTHLASVYLAECSYAEAEPLLLRAAAVWKSSPVPHDLYAMITLSCCGDLYRSTGRRDEARNAEDAAKAVLTHYAK